MTRLTFEDAVLRAPVRLPDGRVGSLWSLPGARSRRPARVVVAGVLVPVDPAGLELIEIEEDVA